MGRGQGVGSIGIRKRLARGNADSRMIHFGYFG